MRLYSQQRLRHQADFVRIREKGSRVDCGSFVLNAFERPFEEREGECFPRFAVIASKRLVSNRAVIRNRAKRIFREIFRLNQKNILEGIDLIIVVRRSFFKANFIELESQFQCGIKRLYKKLKK